MTPDLAAMLADCEYQLARWGSRSMAWGEHLAAHVRTLVAELAALREAASRVVLARVEWLASHDDEDGTSNELDAAFDSLAALLKERPAS